jgi:hypothetical protein
MPDRVCPLGFIVVAAFASGLVWLYTLMASVPLR